MFYSGVLNIEPFRLYGFRAFDFLRDLQILVYSDMRVCLYNKSSFCIQKVYEGYTHTIVLYTQSY